MTILLVLLALPTAAIQVPPPEGLYTDKASYAPLDVVTVFGNWVLPPGAQVQYRVLKAAPDLSPESWPEKTPAILAPALDPVIPRPGSFVSFEPISADTPTLTGLNAFTMDGWIYPTYIAPSEDPPITDPPTPDDRDFIVIAGQADKDMTHGGWIGINRDGHLFAGVRVGSSPGQLILARDPVRLEPLQWYYVAVTFNTVTFNNVGQTLTLYKSIGNDVTQVDQKTGTGHDTVDATTFPFRLGARKEAPGDLTGCFDGRMDRWALWRNKQLTLAQLQARKAVSVGTGVNLGGKLDLFVDFEWDNPPSSPHYPAHAEVIDTSPMQRPNGALINHGAPGMAPGPYGPTDPLIRAVAIRFNHDQIVDAKFPQAVTFQIPGGSTRWSSGLYVVQAVLPDGTGGYLPQSNINKQPEHFTTFVVRPPASGAPLAPIAVVVPTNTWMAYNAWPIRTGILTPRRGVPDQGGNGAYGTMGDGQSDCHYISWLRPNLMASPVIKSTPQHFPQFCNNIPYDFVENDQGAFLAWKFVEWLESPIGSQALPPGSYLYDMFTDGDLDNGTLDLRKYMVLMTFGKHEYWSRSMLTAVRDYVANQPLSGQEIGNVISVSGNTLAWRSELFTYQAPGSPENKILEVRKWPSHDAFNPMPGLQDARSLKDEKRTGVWRYVLECDSTSSGPWDDYILGTQGDRIGGGTCNNLGLSCSVQMRDGFWKVRQACHWLWGNDVFPQQVLHSVGACVGDENDSYVCTSSLTCTSACNNPPTALPSWGHFPWSSNGRVAILADGVEVGSCCDVQKTNWCSDTFDTAYATANKDQLSFIAAATGIGCPISYIFPQGDTAPPTGQIVFYEATGGGKVLHLGSLDSVRGLRELPTLLAGCSGLPVDATLSNMILRALNCIVFNLGCGTTPPDCGDDCGPPPHQ